MLPITYFFIDDALRSVPCTLAPALTRLANQGELTSQLGLLGLLFVHTLGEELCVLALQDIVISLRSYECLEIDYTYRCIM